MSSCRYSKHINSFKAEINQLSRRTSYKFTDDEQTENIELNFIVERKERKKIWEKIQHFFVWPQSFENKEHLCKKLREDLERKYPPNTPEFQKKIDQELEKLLRSADCYLNEENYKKYLSGKAEFSVVDAISQIMRGRPGLLIRGDQLKRKDFEKLQSVLGDFVPNCQCKQLNSHENDCYQMEFDILLIYPGENKLEIRAGEVKRSIDEKLKDVHVKYACRQLAKDVKLIDWILKDVPSDKINVRAFVCLDISESERGDNFCDICSLDVLFQEDLLSTSSKILAEKLFLETTSGLQNPDKEIRDYFKTASARIMNFMPGLLLSQVLEEIKEWTISHKNNTEKQIQIFDSIPNTLSSEILKKKKLVKKWIERYENNLEKQLVIFDEPKYWMIKYQDSLEKQLIIFNNV